MFTAALLISDRGLAMMRVKKRVTKATVIKRLRQVFAKPQSYIPYNMPLIKTLSKLTHNTNKDIKEGLQDMLYKGEIVMFCIDDNEYLTKNINYLDQTVNRSPSLPVRSEFREIVEIDQVNEKLLLYKVGIFTLLVTELLIIRQCLLYWI